MAVVLWQVLFPLQVKYYQTSGHFRLLHIGIVVLASLLPIGPIAAMLATGGFTPFYYPHACVAANADVVFYAAVLPHSIFTAIGLTLLIILFWILVRNRWRDVAKVLTMKCYKVSIYYIIHYRLPSQLNCVYTIILCNMQGEKNDHIKSFTPTTTLIKILATFLCYIIVNIMSLAGFALLLHVRVEYNEELRDYFICEGGRVEPNQVCKRSFENLYTPLPSTVAIFLAGILYQLLSLLYVINLQNVCSSVTHVMQGIRSSNSMSTNETSIAK